MRLSNLSPLAKVISCNLKSRNSYELKKKTVLVKLAKISGNIISEHKLVLLVVLSRHDGLGVCHI